MSKTSNYGHIDNDFDHLETILKYKMIQKEFHLRMTQDFRKCFALLGRAQPHVDNADLAMDIGIFLRKPTVFWTKMEIALTTKEDEPKDAEEDKPEDKEE